MRASERTYSRLHLRAVRCNKKHSSMTLPVTVVITGGSSEHTLNFHRKLRQYYSFGGSLACLAESEQGQETHLAALTCTDTIVVP